MDRLIEELLLHLRAGYPFVILETWEEGRALRALGQIGEKLEVPTRTWTSTAGWVPTLDDGGEALPFALAALYEHEDPGLFILRDAHDGLDDGEVVRRLRDLRDALVARKQAVVFLGPIVRVPRELEKDVIVLSLPLPGLKEVALLFHAALRDHAAEVELALFERFVKASLGLTEDEIRRVYRKVHLKSGRFGEEELALVVAEKAQIIRKSEYLEFHARTERLAAVGGLDNLKGWLESRDLAFTEKARRYGLPQPKGLFLLGVQGCGKSLIAKAVADLWTVPLLRLDVGSLVQGSADEGLRHTIRLAESMSPLVLWVDEIEKAFAGVEAGRDAAAATRLFGNFVTWLQEKTAPVFVVATANDVRNLPPELLRKGRFDEIFFVDLPNVHERQSILDIHIRKRGRDPAAFDTWAAAEATEKFSGAELEQCVIDALFHSFADGRELETRDLLRALRETVPLAVTMDQHIKALKEWARTRTRPATYDRRRIDFFEEWSAEITARPADGGS